VLPTELDRRLLALSSVVPAAVVLTVPATAVVEALALTVVVYVDTTLGDDLLLLS